jgi:hypothetical protein
MEDPILEDCLYPPDGITYHDPGEVLRRIAPAFAHVTIDTAGADQSVRAHHTYLSDLRAPPVVLDGYQQMFGRTAFVTLADDEPGEVRVRFHLMPDLPIGIEYQSADEQTQCRPTVEKLARVLGYEIGATD